jgi:hypothetical protein
VACCKIIILSAIYKLCFDMFMYICVLLCFTMCRCHFPPFLRILLQLFTAPGTMEVPRVRLATVQVGQVMHTNRAWCNEKDSGTTNLLIYLQCNSLHTLILTFLEREIIHRLIFHVFPNFLLIIWREATTR